MDENPRTNPEWEHWPGRSADDGVRNRLRELFTPESGDAVAELIDAHARELEERSDELRAAVAELEQRETRARELHGRVEHVLREGSAELDLRHAELTVQATELDRRETAVREAEARVQERRRELGAVELRGAAVERREQALEDRETDLERRADDLERRAAELDRRALDLDDLSRRIVVIGQAVERDAPQPPSVDAPVAADPPASRPVELLTSPPTSPATRPVGEAESTHVALVSGTGYRIVERAGAPPSPGETVELDSIEHRCVRLAPSPYPRDARRCAILEPVEVAASL